MNRILAVETNLELNEQIAAEWANHNVKIRRVETMNKAIDLLSCDDEYLFIAINEDSVPDYLSQLPTMREVTDTPIFVITSNFTIEKKIKALNGGADVYDPFDPEIKQNVLGAFELLKKLQNRRTKQPKPLQVLTGGEIILSKSSRTVCIKNQQVSLTKKEFEILQLLMEQSGCVVTHKQILQKIWGNEYDESNTDILWRTMNRLRGKLSKHTANKYIKIERGVGYMFLP